MRPRPKAWLAPLALAIAVLAATSCGKSSTTTTAPTPVLVTDSLVGTVQVLGVDTKPFSVQYPYAYTEASITVTSMKSVATGAAIDPATTIGVAFGTILADGTCSRSSIAEPATMLNQEKVSPAVFLNGLYCMQIFDSGTLLEPINYAITLKHY